MGNSIRFFINNSLLYFTLLTINLLTISTWCIFGDYTLKYLIILVYSIKILFQILYIFDLKYFLDKIYVLTLLPNIYTYTRSYLILVKAFLRMITFLFICFIDNVFCKYLVISIAST